VLTNGEYSGAIDTLTAGLAEIILPPAAPSPIATEPDRSAEARALYDGLFAGRLDRQRLTANANGYFTAVALADYRASLAVLGPPTSFVATGAPRLRGGFVNRNYRIVAGGRTLRLITYAEPGPRGRWEQYIVMPQ